MSVYVTQNTQYLIVSPPGQIFENHVNQAANPLSSITMEDEMIDVTVDEGSNERLWPGTGEVGMTHGKESGDAEITIVI
jgi:hypothetical protein